MVAMEATMPKISAQALKEVQQALEQYKKEILAVGYAQNTEKTRISQSDAFVRWLNDEFTPGSGLRD